MLREIEIWQNNFLFFSHHPSFQMCFFSLCVFQVFCFADALLLLIDANLKTFALYLIIISMPFRWTWFLCMIFTKIRVSWHKTFELNRRPKETVALHLYGIEKWNVSDVNVIIFFFFLIIIFFLVALCSEGRSSYTCGKCDYSVCECVALMLMNHGCVDLFDYCLHCYWAHFS